MSRLAAAAAALRRGSAPNNLSILAPCLWLCRRFVCRTQSVIIGFKRAECAPLSAARGHTCAPAPCDNLDQLAAFTLGILQHRPAQSSSLCVLGEWTFFIPVGFVIISGSSLHHTTTNHHQHTFAFHSEKLQRFNVDVV